MKIPSESCGDSPCNVVKILPKLLWRFFLNIVEVPPVDYYWNLKDIFHEISRRFLLESGGDFSRNLMEISPEILWRFPLKTNGDSPSNLK